MKAQFGKLLGGLIIGGGGAATAGGALVTGQGITAAAVAVVIVIGIVCILAIGALWIEMILRQAGIMILVATMPIVLVGQMSDATKDWWPKARDALLALILMKPMIVCCGLLRRRRHGAAPHVGRPGRRLRGCRAAVGPGTAGPEDRVLMPLSFKRRDAGDTSLKASVLGEATGLEQRPAQPPPPAQSARDQRRARLLEDPETVMRVAPAKGWAQPYAGRAASLPRVEAVRVDTANAAGAYPFLHAASLPPVGAYIGQNTLTTEAFSAHPAVWVKEGLCTNPNVMITGIPGSGKSAHIKALCFRLMAFGHRALIAGDVKGEYAALCRHLGVEPVRLGPGLPGRVNPLDAGPLGQGLHRIKDPGELNNRLREIHRRRLTLLKALLELQLRRTLLPQEEEALDVAVREVSGELHGQTRLETPTLPLVYDKLRDPTNAMAAELRVRDGEVQRAREQMESIRSALGAMVNGHVAGLFDDRTSIGLDWDAPIQSVDVSALEQYGDETVAMVLTCVSSWAQAAIDRPGNRPWIVVRDELWRQMRSGGASQVKKIDADLRLSRASGTIQILATHRLSDFEGVGAAGSEAVNIAKDLISSCETRIQLAQDTRPLAITREAIGLTDAECDLIGSWGAGQRGRALWKVGRGGGSHAVQLMLSHTEEQLFETDEKMVI